MSVWDSSFWDEGREINPLTDDVEENVFLLNRDSPWSPSLPTIIFIKLSNSSDISSFHSIFWICPQIQSPWHCHLSLGILCFVRHLLTHLFAPLFTIFPYSDFPWGSAGKESACNTGDLGSIPGLGKIRWRRKRLPTPVFWPGEFHGLYSSWDPKESDRTEGR